MLSPTRYECRVFKILRLTPQKIKPRSARYFETALRAVLFTESILINSGPNILLSYFLHWLHTYIPTLPLQTYKTLHTCPIPAYLHYTYNHYTLLCIPALSLHTSSKSRQSDGAVAFCLWGNTMCCELYWWNYCIWIWLVYWEPRAEGKGVEFPRKSAILADCTTIIVHFYQKSKGRRGKDKTHT